MASRLELGKLMWADTDSAAPVSGPWEEDEQFMDEVDPLDEIRELMMPEGMFIGGVVGVMYNPAAQVSRSDGSCGARVQPTDPTEFMYMTEAQKASARYTGNFPADSQPDMSL